MLDMTTRPMFAVAKLEGDEFSCVCSAPAVFAIDAARTRYTFCATCAVAYALQTLKNNGVALHEIACVFPKLSAALDAPLSSNLLM